LKSYYILDSLIKMLPKFMLYKYLPLIPQKNQDTMNMKVWLSGTST